VSLDAGQPAAIGNLQNEEAFDIQVKLNQLLMYVGVEIREQSKWQL